MLQISLRVLFKKKQKGGLLTIVHVLSLSHWFLWVLCRIIENDLFKQDWRSRTKNKILQYVFFKWTLVLIIGLGTGFVAFFNNLAVENIAGFKLLFTNSLMLKDK